MVKQSNRKDNISLFQSLRIAANTEEIASGIAGGVAIVVIIVGLIIYRNWRYEQELDSLLWKIDYKDIQIPDLPAVSSGQGKAPRVSLRAVRFHISNEREGESTAAIQIFLHSLSRVSIVREIISDSRVFIPLKKTNRVCILCWEQAKCLSVLTPKRTFDIRPFTAPSASTRAASLPSKQSTKNP